MAQWRLLDNFVDLGREDKAQILGEVSLWRSQSRSNSYVRVAVREQQVFWNDLAQFFHVICSGW